MHHVTVTDSSKSCHVSSMSVPFSKKKITHEPRNGSSVSIPLSNRIVSICTVVQNNRVSFCFQKLKFSIPLHTKMGFPMYF